MKRIPIFDTRAQNTMLSSALGAAFARVIESGSFILGHEVSSFERRACALLGSTHAVGVSSGSDALLLALTALGVGPGDEVITSAFSFVATAEAILRAGATPVFADIEPTHFGLCPDSTRRMLSAKTRAVIYVHLYGALGSIAEHATLCQEHGLWLIEDACQAFGARIGQRHAGTWGNVGCFSFFPTKPLGGLGDGGLCVTDDSALAGRLQALRAHGVTPSGQCESIGGNFRLDALQAALLSEKLEHVERWRQERAHIARGYTEALRDCRQLRLPSEPPSTNAPAWSLFTLRAPSLRLGLQRHLSERGIEARVYYPTILADQRALAERCRRDALTEAIRASNEVLSVPLYFGLTREQQQRIVEGLATWQGD